MITEGKARGLKAISSTTTTTAAPAVNQIDRFRQVKEEATVEVEEFLRPQSFHRQVDVGGFAFILKG